MSSHRARLTSQLEQERGSESVSMMLLLPLLLLLVFGVVQGAAWYHGKTLAHAAASAAYHSARALNGTVGTGHQAAASALAGATSLSGTTVQIDRSPTAVTVTISGRTPSIVPFLTGPQVEETVTGPTERWVSK